MADALSVSRGIEATSARLRQGFIYDDTYYNRYVSVLTEYGEDNYIVSNQGNGYDWGEIYPTMKDLYPDSYIGSRSAQIYNSNVDMYEYWPHGDI